MNRVVVAVLAVGACSPGRATFARYPEAATAFDRGGSDAKALAIADQVVAAAGGAERWGKAQQIKWSEEYSNDGKLVVAMDQAWDRWNGRHQARLHKAADANYSVDTAHNPTQSSRAGEGDVVVMHKLYEDGGGAFFDSGHGLMPINAPDVPRAIATARQRWQFDSAALCMPFLLEEPGSKLSYVGEVPGEDGKPPLDELKLTLDPKDTTRTSSYHVMVNRETHLIERIEIVEAGQPDNRRIAFHLGDWVDVGGLKFATRDENVGVKGEVVAFKNIAVGEPDDTLYVPHVE